MKSRSLNLLKPSGPVEACNGIALALPFTVYILPKVQYTYYQKYSINITKNTVYILPKVQYTYYQKYSIHITKSTVYILPKVQYTYYQKHSIHISKL